MNRSAMRKPLLCLAALCFAAAAVGQDRDPPATHRFGASSPIANRYIVVLDPSVADPAAVAASVLGAAGPGAQLHFTYRTALRGFAATLPPAAVTALRANPRVRLIEQDQTVSLNQVQDNATWGLDRIDQADRPLDGLYHYGATGAGVTAFVIDTGIRPDHVEFAGRVAPGYTAIDDGRGTEDCDGHGTHVSGTIGGSTWGVAKEVTLVPVRVLDCSGSGSWSGVIAGVDWVAASSRRPAVANMSLGGRYSSSVNEAVAGAVSQGVTVVVAAGNNSQDACRYSPASEPSAITVAATTSSDTRSSYSNWGTCVDIFAPGSGITSAWNTSSTASNTISGTSMAAPHVSGTVALVAEANPGATPAAIAQFLVVNGTAGRLSSVGRDSPNVLVYSLATGTPVQPETPTIAVKSLSGTSTLKGKNWRAQATVTVRDVTTNALVRGVNVSGAFSPGGAGSCVTDVNGVCSMTSGVINGAIASTSYAVTSLSGSNMVYDASQNMATQITIARPSQP